MSQENVELVQRCWEAWERGDTEAVFAFYDPDIIWDQSGYEALSLAGVYRGHEGVKRFFRDWLEPFETYYAHAEKLIDAGECVIVCIRQGGRGKGSGAQVEMPVFWQLYRLRDGRAVRVEVYSTEEEALEAAGLPE